MKRLLILRHAKSSWADTTQDDWQRPLNDRGRRDAPRAGQWLRERAIVPDLILTSGAVRARTTAQAVATASGFSRDLVTDPSLYLAKPAEILDAVSRVGDDYAIVLVVGHNPGLEDLVHVLTGESHGMVTAALVDLELSIDHWRDLDGTTEASIVATWQPKSE